MPGSSSPVRKLSTRRFALASLTLLAAGSLLFFHTLLLVNDSPKVYLHTFHHDQQIKNLTFASLGSSVGDECLHVRKYSCLPKKTTFQQHQLFHPSVPDHPNLHKTRTGSRTYTAWSNLEPGEIVTAPAKPNMAWA